LITRSVLISFDFVTVGSSRSITHTWFNRFRKLTIRYEKLDATHLALNHLAAAIIALRKVRTKIIYG
jgi:hypothetical protein